MIRFSAKLLRFSDKLLRFSDKLRVSHRAPAPARLRTSIRRIALAACGAVLMGCAAQPGADLPPYGDSVRHMKELQIYHPGDEIAPMGGDKAAEAMRAYRKPASEPQRGSMSSDMP